MSLIRTSPVHWTVTLYGIGTIGEHIIGWSALGT